MHTAYLKLDAALHDMLEMTMQYTYQKSKTPQNNNNYNMYVARVSVKESHHKSRNTG